MANNVDLASELAYQQKRCQELEHQLDKILYKLYESDAQNAKLWAALNLLSPSAARDGDALSSQPMNEVATPDPFRVINDLSKLLASVIASIDVASTSPSHQIDVSAPTAQVESIETVQSGRGDAATPVEVDKPVPAKKPRRPTPVPVVVEAPVYQDAVPAPAYLLPVPVRGRIIEINPPKAATCLANLILQGGVQLIPNSVLGAHNVAFQGLAVDGGTEGGVNFHLRAHVRSSEVRYIKISIKFRNHPHALIVMADLHERALVTSRDGHAELGEISFVQLDDDWLQIDLSTLVRVNDVLSLEVGPSPSKDIKSFQFKGQASHIIDLALISYAVGEKIEARPPAESPAKAAATATEIQTASSASGESAPFGGSATDYSVRFPRLTMKEKLLSEQKSDEIRGQRRALIESFESSGELGRIDELRNRHKGKRAFIIGNGPSILKQDLSLLAEEVTFTTNWFVNHEYFDAIKPKYHVVSSHEMFGGWGAKVPRLNDTFVEQLTAHDHAPTTVFSFKFRDAIREDERVTRNNSRFLIFDRPKFQIDEIGEIDIDLSHPMHDGYTGLITFAVPLALHMGIVDIYMVGCDCDYGIKKPEDPKSYFYRPDQHPTTMTKFESLDRIWAEDGPVFKTYDIVRATVESVGARIHNATHGGRLERLPRVQFESLFNLPGAIGNKLEVAA